MEIKVFNKNGEKIFKVVDVGRAHYKLSDNEGLVILLFDSEEEMLEWKKENSGSPSFVDRDVSYLVGNGNALECSYRFRPNWCKYELEIIE